jgi:hypothetical protein
MESASNQVPPRALKARPPKTPADRVADRLYKGRSAKLRASYGRSSITNGTKWLHGVDQRNPWVRRYKDVIREHIADLGGMDNTTAAERSLIRRASTLTVELERLETKFALANEASDTELDLYGRVAGNLRRLLETIGLQRRPRVVEDIASPEWLRTLEASPAPSLSNEDVADE